MSTSTRSDKSELVRFLAACIFVIVVLTLAAWLWESWDDLPIADMLQKRPGSGSVEPPSGPSPPAPVRQPPASPAKAPRDSHAPARGSMEKPPAPSAGATTTSPAPARDPAQEKKK